MRYFSYIAEQAFKTDEEGRRVFYLGSPRSRPYVITDPVTESRMFRKLTWFYRIFLSAVIVGSVMMIPRITERPLRFFVFLGASMALQWMVLRLMFFRDLRKLTRAPVRPTLKTFYTGVAQRHSVKALKWSLFGSLAFVVAGVTTIFEDVDQIAIGLASAALFSVSAVAWAYSLKLKLAQKAAEAATTTEN
jgi:hypothetical protein